MNRRIQSLGDLWESTFLPKLRNLIRPALQNSKLWHISFWIIHHPAPSPYLRLKKTFCAHYILFCLLVWWFTSVILYELPLQFPLDKHLAVQWKGRYCVELRLLYYMKIFFSNKTSDTFSLHAPPTLFSLCVLFLAFKGFMGDFHKPCTKEDILDRWLVWWRMRKRRGCWVSRHALPSSYPGCVDHLGKNGWAFKSDGF